ncbi:MAG: chaperone modulator CbpM [Ginsengibacter sp.]
METPHLISTDEFCTHHKVEYSFINSLHQFGLIEITTVEENRFIDTESLTELEKFVRLHYDLEINLEGIEAITYLIEKVKSLQHEINFLKNKLSLYEENK